jgi:hypothetical protein
MNAEKHQVEKIMAFEHQQQLNQNALYTWAENLLESARSGRLFTTRAVGLLVAVLLVIGVIVFVTRSGKSDKSRVWTEYGTATSIKKLTEFADANPKSPAAKAARLQAARIVLGPDGLDRLNIKDKDQRAKAIANVEKGREEMTKLADDLKDDLTLRVLCLRSAGEAELALVGIPKEGSTDQYRGTVDKAVEYFNQAAAAAGSTTPAGELAKKKADDLVANKSEIQMLGIRLNSMLSNTGLAPLAPGGLGNPIPATPKPVIPPDNIAPAPNPAAAVAGGAAGIDPNKKEEAPAPRSGTTDPAKKN